MKSFGLVTVLFICFVSRTYAQNSLFWNQYSAGNPAATGVNSDFDASSLTSYYGNSIIRERLNANVRIKKLHGAIGLGYRFTTANSYRENNPYLNYSFHWKIGENSLLAFGAGADFAMVQYDYNADHSFYDSDTRFNFGAHYQFKGLKAGIAFRTHNYASKTVVQLSDAYIDYTQNLGEKWQVNAAFHASTSSNGGSSIMARAIYNNKFWFGASYDLYSDYGFLVGVNLNDRWSLGYSISVGQHGSRSLQVTNQTLLVRFQLGK